MKQFIFKSTVIFMACIFLSCCAKEQRQPAPVQPAPEKNVVAEPTPAKPVVYASNGNQCDPCSLVRLNLNAPSDATLGYEYMTQGDLVALNDASNVAVTAFLPDGASYLKSEPDGRLDGKKVHWYFDAMNKDEVKNLKLWLKADNATTLVTCYTLTAQPRWCVATKVGKPEISLTKSGPTTAQIGQEFEFTIVAKNTGSAVVNDAKIIDELPEGLVHASGERVLTFPIGDMQPGESKEVRVPVKATSRGTFVNVATLKTANAGEAKAEAPVVVKEMRLELVVNCNKEESFGKQVKNGFTVSNPGDTALTNVVVVAEWSAQLKVLSAECDAQLEPTRAVWNFGELAGGAEKSCSFMCISKAAGRVCMKITVTTNEGLTKSEECCTSWKGLPALLIEVVDDPDPLLVSEETTYTISVTNQGTADDQNVTIIADFPAEISAVTVQGDTEGTIESDGKVVKFAPVPVLQPKQKVVWTMKAKGVQQGDSRLKVRLTSNLLKNAVLEEESTQVY